MARDHECGLGVRTFMLKWVEFELKFKEILAWKCQTVRLGGWMGELIILDNNLVSATLRSSL